MANTKISGMTPGSALTGAELFEMVQSAGTFSTDADAIKTWCSTGPLDFTGGTQTTDDPVLSMTQTWNAGGVTFTAIKLNVTSTASAAASMVIDLQVGGASQFAVTKAGAVTAAGTIKAAGYTVAALPAAGTAGRRAYVTDSNAALTAGIGAIVAAGGANVVPVFDDGVNWRIG